MTGRIAGRVAIITGSTSGIGRASAELFAREGARVVVNGRRAELGAQVVAGIRAAGGEAVFYHADITERGSIEQLVAFAVATYGRLDILMNNAWSGTVNSVTEIEEDDWDAGMAIALKTVYLGCRYAIPEMIKGGGGSIINVSSRSGVMGFLQETDFTPTKFGIEGFTKALALELQEQGHNVAINTITPGSQTVKVRIKPTGMTQGEFDALPPAEQARWHDSMLLGPAFVYLALQDGRGLTGARVHAWDLAEQVRRGD